ncbi:anaerobic sulfatase maturase [Alloscardovia macacae]|uniref:Anaerobic sulfatase maturase n=1 Tax=Alloscardovia macacae TaxID=1160091 RepID=A0A1Y2T212_9BIFI|nr:anaerobic sulfatase maturase [Alloscardovia macacae]OTA26951.1 anaerobic sulfatase maturase [Alloscardovia macacae]OTA30061.1 anaerobic sulfatase maturase [Alloscardovia macacae]
MSSAASVLPAAPLTRTQLPFSIVAKPTGAACNLDCQYCFFLSKELLYSAHKQQMSEETLETYVAEYLAASADGEVTMLWQGGEPTLRGLDFFRRLVELCEVYRRPTQTVKHAIQTNGTLITPEWAQFLREHHFLVGISIDGPEEYHDFYRVNRAGRGTHALVVRGWNYLREAGVDCNILCTVHHANEAHGREVYTYFRDTLGADFIQFIPIVERVDPAQLERAERGGWRKTGKDSVGLLYKQAGDAVTSRSTKPELYGQFLCDVFDEWISHDVGRVYVQDFDAALGALFNQYTVCSHAPECGTNMALEFNGDVYACDHWVEPDWFVGNVTESSFADLAQTPVMREFAKKKHAQLTQQCLTCPFRRMCNGGCPKDRFVRSRDGELGQNYLCPGYTKFYAHIRPDMVGMARLLRSQHAPAEIMNPLVRAQVRARA